MYICEDTRYGLSIFQAESLKPSIPFPASHKNNSSGAQQEITKFQAGKCLSVWNSVTWIPSLGHLFPHLQFTAILPKSINVIIREGLMNKHYYSAKVFFIGITYK